MSPPRICVVGSANVDLTFRSPRLPRPGETLTGNGFHQDFGGKGANQAVAAARLGARVSLVARVGDDALGRETLRHYHDEGLDITHVRVDAGRPTGVAAIVVDDRAENAIVVVPGANGELSAADVREAAPAITAAAVVLCQFEVPLEATREAFRLARAAGVRTVLTPAPAQALPAELFQLCDVCVPNETEAELLTGKRVTDLHEAESAARQLLLLGPRVVIVTLGEMGALIADADGMEHIQAVPVRALDTTGAGDAFAAALAVFWAEGLTLREAARRASRVAALSVTRPGAQSAFPRRAEIEAFPAGSPTSQDLQG
jgi:ribokinase